MCPAGRLLVFLVGLCGFFCIWSWQSPLDIDRRLHEVDVKTNENHTGFVMPHWEARCEIYRTRLNPKCLPEQLFKEKRMWDFAELCGVQAAAASLKNLQLEDPIEEISKVLFDNIIATVQSFATGVLTVGLWYQSPRNGSYKKLGDKDKGGKPGVCKQLFVLISFCFTTYLALAAGVTLMIKIFQESWEFFVGVINLETTFTCKSVMLSQILFYKDLLAYLALSSFCILDVVGIFYIAGGTICSLFNLGCQSWCCPMCQIWWKSVVDSCMCFWKCGWCSCWLSCFSYLKWYLCQGCWMVWAYLAQSIADGIATFCKNCFCFCMHCGSSCKNAFLCFCYKIGTCCKVSCILYFITTPHLVCCCLCFVPTLLASALVMILLCLCLLPLVAYVLGAGIGFAVAITIILSIMLAITMVAFYLVSQLVTGLRQLASKCNLEEDPGSSFESEESEPPSPWDVPPDFLGICEYYQMYFQEIFTYLQEQVKTMEDFDMDEKELNEISCLPSVVRKVLVRAKWVSSQRAAFVILVPVVLIFLLIGSNTAAESAVSQLLFWKCYFTEFGCPSDARNHGARTQTTVTLAGVEVPAGWPVFESLPCKCVSCDGQAVWWNSCSPKWAPGAIGKESYACASSPANVQTKEKHFTKTDGFGTPNQTVKASKVDLGYDPGFLGLFGSNSYAEPILMNTYNLQISANVISASKDCTGELLVEEGIYLIYPFLRVGTVFHTLDGWCDCSSGSFVPSAYDQIWHRSAWSGQWTKSSTDFLSAQHPEHPMWTEAWLKDQQTDNDYVVSQAHEFEKTHIPNPSEPFQHFSRSFGPFGRSFASISELYHYLFVDIVWGYISWFITDYKKVLQWIFLEVLTFESLVASLMIWLDVEAQLEKLEYMVIWTRSAASFVLGMLAGLT